MVVGPAKLLFIPRPLNFGVRDAASAVARIVVGRRKMT